MILDRLFLQQVLFITLIKCLYFQVALSHFAEARQRPYGKQLIRQDTTITYNCFQMEPEGVELWKTTKGDVHACELLYG